MPTEGQQEAKKQAKPNKRKQQISSLIENNSELRTEFGALIDSVGVDQLKQLINEKVYKMLAKLKKNNKQINESVINKDDFLEVIKVINETGISENTQNLIQPLVQVNANHGHIYQAKIVNFLLDEVNAMKEMSKVGNVENT